MSDSIIVMIIGSSVVATYLITKPGDWLGKKLCDYLDRENQDGQ